MQTLTVATGKMLCSELGVLLFIGVEGFSYYEKTL